MNTLSNGTIPRANRIQRSRRRGAFTVPGTIYVGRPTLWGNPFNVAIHGGHPPA